ncbi:5-oxoprolinase subunit PxpA [Bacillus sp. B15-48]|uniref:LamB/YcsF family protein n=1 Tax=Bacillus sp. B15-48 TaxID=1548601 RepID=UPI00193EEED7|nr:5-oxoprolinase subunit PxpA [Bacillus sp. B15-48]MBM4760936.1 5-oxoprolinase subunit PxpA [Bacillus sp. B15-48]
MRIDLNADVGESFGIYQMGEDEKLFLHITSANIACGFHAGDFNVMAATVKKAKEHGVAIGAHPAYPDLQGFGRRELKMSPREIYHSLIYQIGALKQFCEIEGVPLHHVKPHGALYNKAAESKIVAEAVAEAVYDSLPNGILFGLAGSELIQAGEKLGLKTASEAFTDRAYADDGKLASRELPNAVLKTYGEMVAQVREIVFNQRVKTVSGNWYSLKADTLCFHSDSENAAHHTAQIRKALEKEGVKVIHV